MDQNQQRPKKSHPRGQALIILAISFLALLAFVGLVTDAGSLYITYTQLKRAVDAAAVAAANNIKYPQDTEAQRKYRITEAAREMLALHNVPDITSLQVYICTDATKPAAFAAMCSGSGYSPRKLAWVEATQNSNVYFLHIFGIDSVPITTSSVGEAAAVDLVLVFDTSESMGIETSDFNPNDFNPGACNASNTCQPLRDAKDAAKKLIGNLFHGYDQVSIVTFDYDAQIVYGLSSNIGDDDGADDGDAFAAVDQLVRLHDDAPAAKLTWYPPQGYFSPPFNPIFPDDRDGDGRDSDPGAPCVDADFDLWDDTSSPAQPCDSDAILDAYDWNANGDHTDDDGIHTNVESMSLLSTCTGCGIRIGKDVLKAGGRSNSVWVMVFLSDGVANLSDTHSTYGQVPSRFIYGFCGNDPSIAFWKTFCIDKNTAGSGTAGRYCIDANASQCPPGTTHTTESGPYSVEDYAFDMVDEAALLDNNANPAEPKGEDILIYSIGLGAAANGEAVLRYMANVGDDNSRDNDECTGAPPLRSCGNYYYAPSAAYLDQIFESIAARIFTKISR